ncbi:putative holin-like toxin [Enterococcus faecium]|uniref:putative holin-like toxin n=1 Tax=Enterococcus faecium TaxID=1352 RepID=UPI0011B03721|nr:putative holin-like toxin [Enterococcus faecium]
MVAIHSRRWCLCIQVSNLRKGEPELSVFETLQLMIAFAMLVLAIKNDNNKK